MSVGQFCRTFLGPKLFRQAGGWYRLIFVDLRQVRSAMTPHLPRGARLLDIGGGDGEPINLLLEERADLEISMLDLSPLLGGGLDQKYRHMVQLFPSTSVSAFSKISQFSPDCISVSDVLHHIPPQLRPEFFSDIRGLATPDTFTLLIKDVEPGYFRSHLGYWADKYISGDKGVSLISQAGVRSLVETCFSHSHQIHCISTRLFETDCPNYLLVFQLSRLSNEPAPALQ